MRGREGNRKRPSALSRMAGDDEIVVRFLNMVRGSLDDKNRRLLEELRLQRPIIFSRPVSVSGTTVTPQEDEDSAPGVSPEVTV
jgi:hypothetical protein